MERNWRLDTNVQILYHQTSRRNAQFILNGGNKMFRGSRGLADGGIYFAISKEQTNDKAQSKGVYITASVRLGRVKEVDMFANESITFTKLLNQGYDSVKINRGSESKSEYVVYNYDQVKILEMEDEDGCLIFKGSNLPSTFGSNSRLSQFNKSIAFFPPPTSGFSAVFPTPNWLSTCFDLIVLMCLKIFFLTTIVIIVMYVLFVVRDTICPHSEVILIFCGVFPCISGLHNIVRQIGAKRFVYISITLLIVSIKQKFHPQPNSFLLSSEMINSLYIIFIYIDGLVFIFKKVGACGFLLLLFICVVACSC